MTHFAVDAAELYAASAQAGALALALDDSNLPRGGLDGIGGAPAVEDAYGDFLGHWSDGLARIREDLDALSTRLCQAADAYMATERGIESASQPTCGAVA